MKNGYGDMITDILNNFELSKLMYIDCIKTMIHESTHYS
jgi:hypothetical protein